ncbi:MAG TPA: response regulator transcription factor [Chitinophagales bacterium]|nr:response regulator transcription factor [Chitinophagales bacterium]
MSIRVEIVEDHENIQSGLAYMISSSEGFDCTGVFSNAEDALESIKIHPPDVVLMDINLPGMSGIECTRRIKSLNPKVLVMMCTVYEDDEKIFNALSAGANGYVLKKSSASELIGAINDLCNGGAPMSSQIARKVVSFFQHPDKSSPETELLTARENEILDMLTAGYRNKEIAEKLFVSVHTVRSHIYHIYEKLHVHSKIEAINKRNGRK